MQGRHSRSTGIRQIILHQFTAPKQAPRRRFTVLLNKHPHKSFINEGTNTELVPPKTLRNFARYLVVGIAAMRWLSLVNNVLALKRS